MSNANQRTHRRPEDGELEFIRRLRRALHRRPELGHHEHRTSLHVERLLRLMGLRPFRPAPTSIAVLIGTGDERPRIAFRADLDAVPVHEATGAGYASRNPGAMHACGHDGHTAALLALARRLTTYPVHTGPVLLLFQQAEETFPSGAPILIKGLPPHLTPDEIFAFHLWPELPANTVGVTSGTLMGSVAGLTFDVLGRASTPSGTTAGMDGADAVAAAVQLYCRLAPGTGRTLSNDSGSALSLGVINGGEGPNRVAEHCRIEGTLRATSWRTQEQAAESIFATAKSVEAETGTTINAAIRSGIRPPVENSTGSARRIEEACSHLGIECRSYPSEPVGVSEDFGWYLERWNGAMFLLGCGRDQDHPSLHAPDFDFDEAVLLNAVDIFYDLAVQRSARDAASVASVSL